METQREDVFKNCPYQDKERVKQKGAKWDSECKKWYFIPSYKRTEEQFQEWLVYGLPKQRTDEGKQSAKRSKKENDSVSNNKKRKTGIKSEEKHAVKNSEKKEKVLDSQNKNGKLLLNLQMKSQRKFQHHWPFYPASTRI